MDDGLELRVCQNPQKVVQDEEEFGREHVTVFDLERTQCDEDVTNNESGLRTAYCSRQQRKEVGENAIVLCV